MKKRVNNPENIDFDRVWAMPNKNTFEILPIKKLLEDEVNLNNIWIDPFANKNKIATYTNDLSSEYDTDYHLDALDFMKLFEDGSIDGVLYDPPYSPRQVSECYNNVGYEVTWDTTKASFWGNHKREISRIVKVGGKVITFGWNSGGIGYKYGFEIQKILLVPHGGWHNDTICTVEIKTHEPVIKDNKPQKVEKRKAIKLSNEDIELIKKLKSLPDDYWDFRESDTKEYTHGIHNYPAMMVSPISRNIIKIVKEIQPIEALLDPFAGSGTVLVEGMLANIPEVAGNDINPLALLLSTVKTKVLSKEDLIDCQIDLEKRINLLTDRYKDEIEGIEAYFQNLLGNDQYLKKGWGDNAPMYLHEFYKENSVDLNVPDFKNIGYWFKPKVIMELSIIKKVIEQIDNNELQQFVFVAFSEVVRLVSNRRNSEFKMYRMPVSKLETFDPNSVNEFLRILQRNIDKMLELNSAIKAINGSSRVSIFKNDSCELNDLPDSHYDLIITSPPYGDSRTTVAYGEFSRLSLQWINQNHLTDEEIRRVDKNLMGGKKYRNGFEFTIDNERIRNSISKIISVDLERAGDVYSFYKDLDKSIESISSKTKKGGYQFWVVGNRMVKGELLLTDKFIEEIAPNYGLTYVHTINRNIPNKVMPSKNSPSNKTGVTSQTMTMEHIVVLRKN